MKLINEQIQAILDGAPDGATKCATYIDTMYFKSAIPHGLKLYNPFVDKWQWVHDCSMLRNLRDLSGLREILELRQEIERLEQREQELAATVDALQEAMYKTGDLLIKLGKIKEFQELDHALCSTPPQNLNAVKREVAKAAVKTALINLGEGSLSEQDISSFAKLYANTKYPSGKE